MVHVYFVLLLTIAPVLLAIRDDFHVVRTDLGDIRGNVLQTLLDKRNFYSFRGIRYAEPPIGELRFKVSNEQYLTNLFSTAEISSF